MAHIFRQKYTKPIPPGANRVKIRGAPYVSWISRGRKIVWPVSPDDPGRYAAQSATYSIRWKDSEGGWHVEHVSTVRSIAERRKLEIEEREERIRHGLLPTSVRRPEATDADGLLSEWERAIIDAGNSRQHATLYRRRAAAVLRHTGAGLPGKLTAADVATLLGEWRREGRPTDGDKRTRPLSVETSNHYATAVKALCAWCVDRGYLDRHPLSALPRLNADRARTFERRALTPDELGRLVEATAKRTTRAAVPGPDRAMAYLVVAYTGLRLKELSQLTRESFRLDQSPPAVALAASKGKPPTLQVIPEAIVPKLREYLAGKPARVRLWHGGRWSKERRASDILRSDLKAAGIPYKDASGRVLNFHALRTTYGTWLAQAGVPIQHAQKLMRHSDPKTTVAFYQKLGDVDLAGQLDKLPPPK